MNWFVYDFFNRRANGSYWNISTLNRTQIPRRVKSLENEVRGLLSSFGMSVDKLNQENYVGGIKRDEQGLAIFRIYNGGRDCVGRLGRWVLLVCDLLPEEIPHGKWFDVSDVLESPCFCDYAAQALRTNAPMPAKEPAIQWFPIGENTFYMDNNADEGKRIKSCSHDFFCANENKQKTLFIKKEKNRCFVCLDGGTEKNHTSKKGSDEVTSNYKAEE
jgi:hypothetical protein